TSVVDRNMKTPYQNEYSLAMEREIWQESSISVRYIHRDFKDQLSHRDLNNAPGDYGRCVVQKTTSDPYLLPSPGTGPGLDEFTGKVYQDTDPGDGDGRQDDCVGKLLRLDSGSNTGKFGPAGLYVNRPDGIPDLYILNPAWGNIFQIGNYNSAKYDGLIL